MMFMGEFSHTIDTKGRLIIPAKLREQLGESCIMTKSFDNCLAIYTSEMFAAKAAALMNQPNGKAGVRGLKRQIFANWNSTVKGVFWYRLHCANMPNCRKRLW